MMQTMLSLFAKAYSHAAMLKAFLIDKSNAPVHPKIFVGAEYIRSDTDNGLYIRAVENANDNFEAFLNFKRNEDYRVVLEHVSYEQGRATTLRYLKVASDLRQLSAI